MSTEEDQSISQPEHSASPIIVTENLDEPASSPCTVSSTASPPTSPLPHLIPNHACSTLLMQETFVADPDLLSQLVDIGAPLEGARKALLFTGNYSMERAIKWLQEEDRDMETPIEKEMEAIRDACHPGRNLVDMREFIDQNEDSDSFDMEEDMEMMLMLVVDLSLNLSPGKMSLAGAKATARLTLQVKEVLGLETLFIWGQCGRNTEVRGVKDSQEMERIWEQVQMCSLLSDFGRQSRSDVRDKEVLAVFGDVDDLQEVLGHLPLVK
eukprot:GFUD01041114.1.p1 GENE.GFUD01041114.1~~GFUD01041114.1.p1  ORF type:complete len:268 (-),score=102.63 GFUD01041114.1:62-865(-)